MSALAIARHEFVARLRSEPPHWVLFGAVASIAVAAFAAAWLVSAAAPRQGPDTGWTFYLSSGYAWRNILASHRGDAVFVVSLALVALAVVLGPIAACATLNRERDARAVESLLLTGASPLAIAMGKVGAALLRTLLVIAATVPALAVAWLFGGVSMGTAAAAAAVIVALALLSSAIGVLMSSLTGSNVLAVLLSYLLLALLVSLAPAAFVFSMWAGRPTEWLEPLYFSSPILTLWLNPQLLADFQRALPYGLQDFSDVASQTWQGLPLANVLLAATTAGYVVLAGALIAVTSMLLDPYHPLRGLRLRWKLGRRGR